MSQSNNIDQTAGRPARRRPRWPRVLAVALPLAALSAGYAGASPASPASKPTSRHGVDHKLTTDDRAAAMQATAGFQDVAVAEGAGYASSIDALGCFQSPGRGGMGVHYVNGDLMDATVDIRKPEALVYQFGPA